MPCLIALADALLENLPGAEPGLDASFASLLDMLAARALGAFESDPLAHSELLTALLAHAGMQARLKPAALVR
eukprot:3299969-Prymnesium_polylepis.1